SLPGLGRLVFQAIANRDLLVVRNVVMLLAAMVVIINFIVDVLYVVIDPRLRTRARTT
ncbi:MAG: ABC transporter permease subunit, partial [Caldimonas sp.]